MNKNITYIPFMYSISTRFLNKKNYIYNAAMAWVPGVIISYIVTELSLMYSIANYAIGFLCFVCVYEIGYIFNDTYSLKLDEAPRKRSIHRYSYKDIGVFIIIRIATVSVIAQFMNWFYEYDFWGFFLALSAVLFVHNITSFAALKVVTFFQLAVMRFVGPIFMFVDDRAVASVVLCAIIYYALFRLLSYLDAKKRLRFPERRYAKFRSYFFITLIPISVMLFVLSLDMVYLVVNFYYAFIMFIGATVFRAYEGGLE